MFDKTKLLINYWRWLFSAALLPAYLKLRRVNSGRRACPELVPSLSRGAVEGSVATPLGGIIKLSTTIMKLKILILAQFIFTSFLFCQNHNPFIEDLMNQANLDSLVSFVRILSGEDSVMISDTTVLISHRISYLGNDLAADYIKQKLESYELETYDQRYSEFGRNIYSIQRGTAFPDIYFIYCAHYDAVTEHCADDNASGVAGVLEAARILSNYQFDYTIIYALWDEEEYGGIGSRYFAASANSNNMDIQGVLNFEMGGWDSNNDGLMDIHTRNIANSVSLATLLMTIDSLYNLPLDPVVYNPGTHKSDHSSFWLFNYSAIEFCQAYWGGDYNPYYHSSDDRIDKFNLTYFYNIAKLGIGAIATLAFENPIVSVKDNNTSLPNVIYINNYPNPFNNSTTIYYEIPEDDYISLTLYNHLSL
ncbi:MAG: M20/M25/M40 family metallo-hydrolase [Bacteroidetes bacterium]|nr:M20/M25/M40 family metallo-hydrolase [Bacteroidota bacterium]